MKIGFIGTGNMGEPMARNLIHAGHELTVFNRTRERAERLRPDGARVADSAAGAASDAEIVITMLADDRAVEQVAQGMMEALRREAIHMSCSTISVELSRRLAEMHAARGQGYVSATVLGRPEAAAAKKLWVMAAGPAGQVERCRPLMEAIGRGISVVGTDAWKANLVKIGANFMIVAMLETFGEVFALLRKSGVDSGHFLAVINEVFASPIYANYGRIVAEEKFEPAGFKLRLGLKDISLVLASAAESEVPMPLASLIRDHFLEAIAHGASDLDWAAVAKVAANHAGVTAL
ncbi:MAG: NAD(P)-dependent oxidoreductase [Acidobacteria bacterium]|nr:NAD(P)-dependent oxidoreductase [Acidobacteriota bacterium]